MAYMDDLFGFERGPEATDTGELSHVHDFLARYEGSETSRYDMLQDVFGASDDPDSPGWQAEEAEELLRSILGPAEEFAEDYAEMSEAQRKERFADPLVAEVTEMWAAEGVRLNAA
jgi:hypothetical protein